eukprot:772769-Rhodomonas_salina.1
MRYAITSTDLANCAPSAGRQHFWPGPKPPSLLLPSSNIASVPRQTDSLLMVVMVMVMMEVGEQAMGVLDTGGNVLLMRLHGAEVRAQDSRRGAGVGWRQRGRKQQIQRQRQRHTDTETHRHRELGQRSGVQTRG